MLEDKLLKVKLKFSTTVPRETPSKDVGRNTVEILSTSSISVCTGTEMIVGLLE